jgi:hypothetical protein
MEEGLLISLINKGVIREGTEIGIVRPGTGMDGSRIVSDRILVTSRTNGECKRSKANHITEVYKIDNSGDKTQLFVGSTVDGCIFKIASNHIFTIDGMTPEDIAKVYNLDLDGARKKTGRKRGRKPKNEMTPDGQDNQLQRQSG